MAKKGIRVNAHQLAVLSTAQKRIEGNLTALSKRERELREELANLPLVGASRDVLVEEYAQVTAKQIDYEGRLTKLHLARQALLISGELPGTWFKDIESWA